MSRRARLLLPMAVQAACMHPCTAQFCYSRCPLKFKSRQNTRSILLRLPSYNICGFAITTRKHSSMQRIPIVSHL